MKSRTLTINDELDRLVRLIGEVRPADLPVLDHRRIARVRVALERLERATLHHEAGQ